MLTCWSYEVQMICRSICSLTSIQGTGRRCSFASGIRDVLAIPSVVSLLICLITAVSLQSETWETYVSVALSFRHKSRTADYLKFESWMISRFCVHLFSKHCAFQKFLRNLLFLWLNRDQSKNGGRTLQGPPLNGQDYHIPREPPVTLVTCTTLPVDFLSFLCFCLGHSFTKYEMEAASFCIPSSLSVLDMNIFQY